ncbi:MULTISPECIES: ABC transporter ATP-binding protein [unclassified Lentimonas]|uniref:ABC transporter ATP-binding protein n=1 Tax=unclassified Lentimonas TaxID=2630993 RepID=UPI001327D073|nr:MULTISPECIES: ABC transporter ATP-binding protein [unclassified Lentimonas]CAA6677436.1 Vitamin B12 ABC transporter, ATPase component BtuD [Lentimonas sp. CC4]CAA6686406.1 Vitamin B12 ABC transporter, ATPase component BtuD [Lentimonas sp. CC6]CAA7074682.1 Vitamin B12 ABC transporter, ATPase component BtuD [Lentimonas sp. CC4]CAA7169305.1 Vitamin B12 ABC transporter, ATPase component BtuD [Lentimonas sp. CC21]CAA7180301.1 Vitamin B12 ABC transporter, ATPase component BtuD [Lentimonas sp. CC8
MNTVNTVPKLNVEDLVIGYQVKGQSQATLKALNLAIQGGEFICLLGPNGTGKSTLIRTLAGVQAPLSGNLQLQGKDFHAITPRERARMVSIVFTDSMPIGMMDAYAFAALGRHPYSGWLGGLNDHDHIRIQWALEAVGAEALSQRQVAELSDGERQKVSIARALAQESQLMLLDEPTAFLDLPRRVELMRILRDLSHREQIGMLLSTHDLDLALRYADRLWLITPDGELIQGAPESLALSGELERAFANENLDWDPEAGAFRTHKTPCVMVALSGEGPAALWTSRAFARLGIGITEDANHAFFSTTISQHESKTSWVVTKGSDTHTFTCIEDLVDWIRQLGECHTAPK